MSSGNKIGLLVVLTLIGLGSRLAAQVVINEIHYNPDVKTERVEFVELYNAGSEAVDLGGWHFSSGVKFTFPAGSAIGGKGYVVVAEHPAALLAKYAVAAFGPWEGKLDNDGEEITLRDVSGRVVDRVEYGAGFPWPTVGDPPGYSIELVNATLDNDLAGSWRGSVVGDPTANDDVLLPVRSTWRYFKGTEEPSVPMTAWRESEFDDGGWLLGAGPIGYDPSILMGTTLSDMRYHYTTVYFRREFQVTEAAEIGGLTLRALYDDGFKVWINGTHVIDVNMASGEVPHTGTAGTADEDGSYRTFALGSGAGYLRDGANVIAIQAANSHVDNSSDFYLDIELLAQVGPAGRGPTPGALNSVHAANVPPQIRQVSHEPMQPRGGQPVRVTAKVTDADGVAEVTLLYQEVEPGAYVALGDPAYAVTWQEVGMRDDGTGGDALAGDAIYTVELPGVLQVHRRLIRYRIRVADALGNELTVPYPDDPQPNFAYFTYDGVRSWTGAVRPGDGGSMGVPFTVSEEGMNRLPVYHLISRRESVEYATGWRLAGFSGSVSNRYTGDLYHWQGTLVYDGRVYDHVRFRARGGVWRYSMVKNMWKIDFNRGHELEARDNWGRKFRSSWRKLNLGASIQQGDYDHRGEQGMFEAVGLRLFQLADVPSPHTVFAQFRVITDTDEVRQGNQYDGDFWGLYLVVEQEGGRFLDERGLADSNLYKMEGGTGELSNLGASGPANKSDLNYVLSSYNGATDSWWRATWDLEGYWSYQAIVQGIHHYDISFDKNYYYYTNSSTGRWEVFPWDLDLTWAHNMFHPDYAGIDRLGERILNPNRQPGSGAQSGTYVMRLSGARPAFEIEFRNRVREIRDLLFNDDQGWSLIDEYAGLLRMPGGEPGILEADRAMWDYNPKMGDGNYTPNLGKAGQGRFYQFPRESATNATLRGSFNATVQLMKNYVTIRGGYLDELAHDPAIPARPTVAYAGPEGYPLNRLMFQASDYVGSRPFAAMAWRVGEVTDLSLGGGDSSEPWVYEIASTWESGSQHNFSSHVTLPVSAVRPGRSYRVRVRMQDDTGRWSRWSAPVQFVAAEPDQGTALVQHLRITELMYQPPEGGEFEYVELQNGGVDETLNLEGVKFTSGIDYTFPAGTLLGPGEYCVVMRHSDVEVFRAYYGLDGVVKVVGPYDGALANEGEEVVLKTTPGGVEIVSFKYGNSLVSLNGRGWPVSAAGAGHSLVPLDRAMGGQATGSLDYPGNWRASTYRGGSPGRADPMPLAETVVLNELAAHTDYEDPLRPEHDSNDWIELYHVGGSVLTLTGWYLSDDVLDLKKWALPSVVMPGGGRISFDEVNDFHNPITSGFGLNKGGEQVLLSYLPGTGEDRVVDAVRFEGQENETSWGRYPDGGAHWGPMWRTRGGSNVGSVPSIVLSEIMYYPSRADPDLDNVADEYLELWNPGPESIELFSASGLWRVEGGVRYTFPAGTVLGAGASMVLVSFDPADTGARDRFRLVYGMTNDSVSILGPYAGKLSNRSDRLALERPQAPDDSGEPHSWVIVDEVIYGNQDPWPSGALGSGYALHRIAAGVSGNRPGNWFVARPAPGARDYRDRDGDGMPDDWELLNDLDADNPSDAVLDSDEDGMTNLEEYLAGTDPRDAGSALRFEWVEAGVEGVSLGFRAVFGRGYTVLYTDEPASGSWSKLEDVDAGPGVTVLTVVDEMVPADGSRYYRVVTPARP
jgi:hypothetical protein